MTRSAAREIAIHCSYSLGFSNQSPEEFLEERMDRVHFQRWGEESPLYQDYPNDKQMQYIREVVRGVAEHGPELDQYIAQYSKNWNFARIPLTAAAIMRVAMYEILYMPEIPAAAAINDAENGIGHLSCDDPKIMEQVRAHWRRLYDTYMNADALLSDLESCARHLTDGDKWEPNPIADGMKPMEMAKGCACFIAETPDGGLIIPSEPTPGENTAKRLANTLNALTGDVLLDATGIRLLGTQFLFAYHSRLDRPVDYGVNLTGMRFPDRLGLLDRADRHPGFLPLRPVVANGTGALERSGRELWAITARTLGRLPHGGSSWI